MKVLRQKRKRQPSPQIAHLNLVKPMPVQPSLAASRDSVLQVMGADFRPAKLEKLGELDDRQVPQERPCGTVSPQRVQRDAASMSGSASSVAFTYGLTLPAIGSVHISNHPQFRNWRQQPEVLVRN